MKPSERRAAQKYANAFCGSFTPGEALVNAGVFAQTAELLAESEPFLSPAVSKKNKRTFVQAVFKSDAPLSAFYTLLIDNGRLNILRPLAAEITKTALTLNGITEAEVTSAYKMTEKETLEIKKALCAYFSAKDARITFKENKDLLGGVLIKTEQTTIDGTMRRALAQLKQNLV